LERWISKESISNPDPEKARVLEREQGISKEIILHHKQRGVQTLEVVAADALIHQRYIAKALMTVS
jgi:hypothetical protein